MPEIKIKKSYLQAFWFLTLRWVHAVLKFLSLRNGQPYWGMVYDSVSKQPLDPVIVKLVYAESGEPVQTCVTDLSGRYGFLAKPGKFKILAKKSNYLFPSQRIISDNDGIFTDIYRGQFFELRDESEVVGPNIPMDPVQFDWNQQAKKKVLQTYPFISLFFGRLIATLFWFGWAFVLIVLGFELYFSKTVKLNSGWFIAALLYLGLFILNWIMPQPRLWGKMVDRHGQPVGNAALALTSPVIDSVVFAKATTQDDGRFLLRANPGDYILKVSVEGAQNQLPVTIRNDGVLNLRLRLLWISQ